MLTEKGQTYEKDGAIWFKASDFGDDQDRVLVRANGIPTYFVPDIAYHYNKLVTRGLSLIHIFIVSVKQFKRHFSALGAVFSHAFEPYAVSTGKCRFAGGKERRTGDHYYDYYE